MTNPNIKHMRLPKEENTKSGFCTLEKCCFWWLPPPTSSSLTFPKVAKKCDIQKEGLCTVNFLAKMSEKYLQIGVPMQDLPRPPGSAHYKRVESSLSNPLANAIKFHDCFHNASMTNLRDLKDPVSSSQQYALKIRKKCNLLGEVALMIWNLLSCSSFSKLVQGVVLGFGILVLVLKSSCTSFEI